jgi:sterol-4alpha-carboxylate 3-dehydrogenase (decarboxylating)
MSSVNVTGTENIIAACVEHKVPKLIYTSTASVVFQGEDLIGVDETAPYASRPMDYYTKTKIEAEKLVLAASGRGGTLATCALRPSGIFGERDPLLVPKIVSKAASRSGFKFIIGNGENFMDYTYVGNIAQAHLQAADKLTFTGPITGQAYFITNDEPVSFWGFLGDLLEGLGYPRPHIKLPAWLILFLAFIFEYMILPLTKPFTTLTTDFTLNRINLSIRHRALYIGKAKRELGYRPRVSVKEGISRTVAHFEHLSAKNRQPAKKQQ